MNCSLHQLPWCYCRMSVDVSPVQFSLCVSAGSPAMHVLLHMNLQWPCVCCSGILCLIQQFSGWERCIYVRPWTRVKLRISLICSERMHFSFAMQWQRLRSQFAVYYP